VPPLNNGVKNQEERISIRTPYMGIENLWWPKKNPSQHHLKLRKKEFKEMPRNLKI